MGQYSKKRDAKLEKYFERELPGSDFDKGFRVEH
jgi:hypothetical protein